jgi:hypothetical protein
MPDNLSLWIEYLVTGTNGRKARSGAEFSRLLKADNFTCLVQLWLYLFALVVEVGDGRGFGFGNGRGRGRLRLRFGLWGRNGIGHYLLLIGGYYRRAADLSKVNHPVVLGVAHGASNAMALEQV